MKISEKNLYEILNHLNSFLLNIRTVSDLKKHSEGGKLYLGKQHIEVKKLPEKEFAYRVSYVWEGIGVPIEVRIDYTNKNSMIILKCQNKIREFDIFQFPFPKDKFNNYYQSKTFGFIDLNLIKNELKRLEEYLSSI